MDDGIIIANQEIDCEEQSDETVKRKAGVFERCRRKRQEEKEDGGKNVVELANKIVVTIFGDVTSMKPILQRKVLAQKVFRETTLEQVYEKSQASPSLASLEGLE